MLLKPTEQTRQLRECLRQQPLQRGRRCAGRQARLLGYAEGSADTGDHILALGVDQELTVKLLSSGRRIAGEGYAGRRGVAAVSKHHGLDIDRRSPIFGYAVQTPVGSRAGRLPGLEHRSYGPPQLLVHVLGKRPRGVLGDDRLVAVDHQ